VNTGDGACRVLSGELLGVGGNRADEGDDPADDLHVDLGVVDERVPRQLVDHEIPQLIVTHFATSVVT
jgi:hypothetical protein